MDHYWNVIDGIQLDEEVKQRLLRKTQFWLNKFLTFAIFSKLIFFEKLQMSEINFEKIANVRILFNKNCGFLRSLCLTPWSS